MPSASPWYLKLVDTQTRGPRYDVTPLFSDYAAFTALVNDLAARFEGMAFDVVAGIDALGFILGAALALRLQKGFVPIRKAGKLPVQTRQVEFVDYSGKRKALELRQNALWPGARVLLADEWIETGAQMKAAISLIEGQGGIVIGIVAINIDRNAQTRPLQERYNVQTVWEEAG
jgi:adenine phosphoribosyltransferase